MSFHNEEQFLAGVAAALGETIALVRRRGFHLERATNDGDMRLTHSHARHHAVADDDTLDLAGYGIDWDADDESRLQRRPRPVAARRRRSRTAA